VEQVCGVKNGGLVKEGRPSGEGWWQWGVCTNATTPIGVADPDLGLNGEFLPHVGRFFTFGFPVRWFWGDGAAFGREIEGSHALGGGGWVSSVITF
jgi:hypothetical protein